MAKSVRQYRDGREADSLMKTKVAPGRIRTHDFWSRMVPYSERIHYGFKSGKTKVPRRVSDGSKRLVGFALYRLHGRHKEILQSRTCNRLSRYPPQRNKPRPVKRCPNKSPKPRPKSTKA